MINEVNSIKEQILPLLKEAGVLKSALFGSVARGEAGPDSDIDILVEFPEDSDMFDLVKLEEKIEKNSIEKLTL